MLDDGELPEPKTDWEKGGVVQVTDKVLPGVKGHLDVVQVQVHTLNQISDTQSRALVVLELLPEYALEGDEVSASNLLHENRVELFAG